jgi:hypothetical protein
MTAAAPSPATVAELGRPAGRWVGLLDPDRSPVDAPDESLAADAPFARHIGCEARSVSPYSLLPAPLQPRAAAKVPSAPAPAWRTIRQQPPAGYLADTCGSL